MSEKDSDSNSVLISSFDILEWISFILLNLWDWTFD